MYIPGRYDIALMEVFGRDNKKHTKNQEKYRFKGSKIHISLY
jgi:hypothetical protein